MEKKENGNAQDKTTDSNSEEPETHKKSPEEDGNKESDEESNDIPREAIPSDFSKHSPPAVKREKGEPRQFDQSSEASTTSHTTVQITYKRNENAQTPTPKYTLQHARTVDNQTLTDKELTSPHEIPKYILETLMIGNYHAREFELKQKKFNKSKNDNDSEDSEDEDSQENDVNPMDELISSANECNDDSNESDEEDIGCVNPMDALLDIFQNSDDSLRRFLVNKLSACQLSVPFLLPDPAAPSENVTILLSALEEITKCWKDGSSTKQVFATEHPFPVVSFIRIGETTMSKSLLINKIMSDGDSYQDFFFHKNMKGGHIERKTVDGLVELSWFLPGGSEKQTIKSEICFANLRGDAKRFKKQLDVLIKISSVLCILLPSKYREETGETIPKEISNFKQTVILVFNEKIQTTSKKLTNKRLSLITRADEKNEDRFLQVIRKNIQTNVEGVEGSSLVELRSHLTENCIRFDDVPHQPDLDLLLQSGIKDAKNLLKLQKHIPKLAALEFSSKDDDINENIEKEKMAQKESFQQLDERTVKCLNCIATIDEANLNKIKHQFDIMSLQIMTGSQGGCRKVSRKIPKKEETPKKLGKQSSERLNLEESMTKGSFGLENFIRELAQLYQIDESKYDYFADAAADMLLSGQPLEILDGDSFYIPLKWFEAVYSKLERKTNNAKIFVISVVGIQSSGKSTMLNTMFGLEFPVSFGRCTRGVFASLIPVSESLKSESKFDYILVVDTEGLTGSADQQSRKHDNKLATFTLGVADVAIVNIFGENYNEIKEYLEIAVSAFLTLKDAEKKKKFCKIVHQNVVAIDAGNILTKKRLSLKHDLDKITNIVARQKNFQCQTLDDIISFDVNEDVFYMPNLLKGSLPMAPVNLEYGRAAQRVKENIIKRMCAKESLKLSISSFRERVCNLWKAIQTEDFIFNLRNILELRASVSLDQKLSKEFTNSIVIKMMDLQKEIEMSLKKCKTREERKEKWEEREEEIKVKAGKLKDEIKGSMNIFFDTYEDREILKKWREEVMRDVEYKTKEKVLEVIENCKRTFDKLQDLQDSEDKKLVWERTFLNKVNNLITSKAGIDDEKFEMEFQKEWESWIKEVPEMKEKESDINNDMVEVLRSTDSVLQEEMSKKLEQRENEITNFREITPKIDDDQLIYNDEKIGTLNIERKQCHSDAETICKVAERKALKFVEDKSISGTKCTREYLKQMYHKVISTIKEETDGSPFKFGKSLKCDILLNTFANGYELFEKMEKYFIRQHDIRCHLADNMRSKLEQYSKNVREKTGKENAAAASFVKELEAPIESALLSTMGIRVASRMLNEGKYASKGQFHAHVLIELGKKRKFASYIPYLEDPIGFLKAKLEESVKNEFENPLFLEEQEKEIKRIEQDVFAAISRTGSKKGSDWVEQFVKECKTLEIQNKTAVEAAIADLENVEVFQEKVEEKIKKFGQDLINRGLDRETIEKWDPRPADVLFTHMSGCQSVCPFCKALCDLNVQDHSGKHSTKSHRPEGINGTADLKTLTLTAEICTKRVAGNEYFTNTSGESYKYKEYQLAGDNYKSWLIPEDPKNETSKYFQWFMAKFSRQLAEHYKGKEPDIPKAWKGVKFNEAKAQLQREYKL